MKAGETAISVKKQYKHSDSLFSSAPPLPPRSPRSPRSPKSPPFLFGELALGETRGHGSDPNIFHRMQHLDALTIREETTVQRPRTPQPPRKSKMSSFFQRDEWDTALSAWLAKWLSATKVS
ncbi:hypothetical protein OS493_006422 [Desmophyllum pertusum]|uniref:Uncharacterized protein n=1 Tax=Desmophyllum pertusum TaxID=174260 RepID=A0A9X0DC81_9CNID|nr:hypothetical protein OS493_006422 [Desmophyllum pertusum]